MTTPGLDLARLRRTNLLLGVLHAAQGIAVLALGNGFALPVTGSFLEGPPGSGPGEARVLFEVSFAVGVADPQTSANPILNSYTSFALLLNFPFAALPLSQDPPHAVQPDG